jgi:hypothetical protein
MNSMTAIPLSGTEVTDAGPDSAENHQEFISREHTTLIDGGGADARQPKWRLIMHNISPGAIGALERATVLAVSTLGGGSF